MNRLFEMANFTKMRELKISEKVYLLFFSILGFQRVKPDNPVAYFLCRSGVAFYFREDSRGVTNYLLCHGDNGILRPVGSE